MIEERYGRRVVQISQEIRAVTVAHAVASTLQVAPGSAALKIIRWYRDAANRTFEVSVSVHPADRFAVSMQLRLTDR